MDSQCLSYFYLKIILHMKDGGGGDGEVGIN